ncbi:hypothetical protein [Nocardia donostiensis]|nr:hypothetical protein [Nocardia donostiensis]
MTPVPVNEMPTVDTRYPTSGHDRQLYNDLVTDVLRWTIFDRPEA